MNDARALYKSGTALIESDPERALDCLTRSLELAPNVPPAVYNRIVVLARLGRDCEAVGDLEILERLDPTLGGELRAELKAAAVPYTEIGNSAFESGQVEVALKKYESALAYDPAYANAWIGRGIVLNQLGQSDQALECFNMAIALEPDNYSAWINRAEFHHDRKQLDQAVHDYSKAIEILPDHPNAYLCRAAAYDNLGRSTDALADRSFAKRYTGEPSEGSL